MSKAIAVLGVVAGLGVAALPLSSYAATASDDVKVQAVIEDSISIAAADETVTMSGVVADAANPVEASTTLTVKTNAAGGYKVEIKDADADTALKSSDAGATAEGIPAGTPAQSTNAWGYKTSSTTSGVTGLVADYTAVTADNVQIATATRPTAAAGDTITLGFGVTVNAGIAAGTYEDTVTLTATTL